VSIVLLGLALVAGVALLAFDVWQSRREDRFAAEEQAPGASVIQRGFARLGDPAPILARVASPLAIVYGILSFPATLAPVVLAVLAMHTQPLGGDGTTALVSMIVAGLSMSAGIKAIRAGGLLLATEHDARRVVVRSTFYVMLWAVLVLCLVSMARPAPGPVATLIYVYAAVTLGVAVLLRLGQNAVSPAAPQPTR
tara:strand:- start:7564 stop:8151 length:588 start_codon:yes stop_codon:yes gene_type:complete